MIIQLCSVQVPLVTRKMEYIQALKVNYSHKIMSAESHFSFRVQYLQCKIFSGEDEGGCCGKAQVQEPGLSSIPASGGEQAATGIKSELV